jgi:predicted amidohydrolase
MSDGFRIAAVQAAPVWFDQAKSAAKACELIQRAGAGGATLAAFGETWLPGYPAFVSGPGLATIMGYADGYLRNAVDIPGPVTEQLGAAAREAGVDVVIGVLERDAQTSGSAYCTALMIGADGEIVGKHRKLKPTLGERIVWAEAGDASGLRVHTRPYARVSMLNCWEHNMVLPGYVLMAEGTQVHVALWPGDEEGREGGTNSRQLILSRAFASQAGAYVICVGGLWRPEDMPAELRGQLLGTYNGGSFIIDPLGGIVAGPAVDEEILFADVSLGAIRLGKAMCDVAGHYSRPDVFTLSVDRRERRQVHALDAPVLDHDGQSPSTRITEPHIRL